MVAAGEPYDLKVFQRKFRRIKYIVQLLIRIAGRISRVMVFIGSAEMGFPQKAGQLFFAAKGVEVAANDIFFPGLDLRCQIFQLLFADGGSQSQMH